MDRRLVQLLLFMHTVIHWQLNRVQESDRQAVETFLNRVINLLEDTIGIP